MFVKQGEWVTKPSEVRDYLFMYERVIPEILKKYDPETFYWPASPSSGGCFDDPSDPNRGDVHYWDVWHGNKPFSDYRNYYFRYASEFGFQSFPSFETIKLLPMIRQTGTFSLMLWKNIREMQAQTERS